MRSTPALWGLGPCILLETSHVTSKIHTSYWRPLTWPVRSTHLIRDLSQDQWCPHIILETSHMTSESTHLIRDSHSTSESTHSIRDLSQHQCVPRILLETNHRTSEIHTSYWRPLTRTVRSTHLIRDLSHDQCSPGIALVVDIVQPLQVGSHSPGSRSWPLEIGDC